MSDREALRFYGYSVVTRCPERRNGHGVEIFCKGHDFFSPVKNDPPFEPRSEMVGKGPQST